MSVRRLERKLRSVGIAYVLFLIIGAHYAYVNKWGIQILYWITFAGFGIWWLIDVFRIPGIVEDYNDPIHDEIDYLEYHQRDRDDFFELRRMRAMRSGNLLEDNRSYSQGSF